MHFIISNTKSVYVHVIDFIELNFLRGVGGIVVNMDFI